MGFLLAGEFLVWIPGWHAVFAWQSHWSAQQVADAVVRIAFDPARDPRDPPKFNTFWPGQKVVGTSLPVRVTGIPPGMAVCSDRVTVAIDTPDGRRWSSGWDFLNKLFPKAGTGGGSLSEGPVLPGDGEYWLYVNIDSSFYHIGTGTRPVHLHARLALTLLSEERVTPLALNQRAQAVPNDGFCWVTSRKRLVATNCAWRVRTPAKLLLRAPGAVLEEMPLLGVSLGSYGPYPASGGLWQWASYASTMSPPPVRMELATREAVAHFERELDIPDMEAWPKQ